MRSYRHVLSCRSAYSRYASASFLIRRVTAGDTCCSPPGGRPSRLHVDDNERVSIERDDVDRAGIYSQSRSTTQMSHAPRYAAAASSPRDFNDCLDIEFTSFPMEWRACGHHLLSGPTSHPAWNAQKPTLDMKAGLDGSNRGTGRIVEETEVC